MFSILVMQGTGVSTYVAPQKTSFLFDYQTNYTDQTECRVILDINSKHSLFSLHQDQFLEDWMNRFSPNKKYNFFLQIMRLSHFKHTLRNFNLFKRLHTIYLASIHCESEKASLYVHCNLLICPPGHKLLSMCVSVSA